MASAGNQRCSDTKVLLFRTNTGGRLRKSARRARFEEVEASEPINALSTHYNTQHWMLRRPADCGRNYVDTAPFRTFDTVIYPSEG